MNNYNIKTYIKDNNKTFKNLAVIEVLNILKINDLNNVDIKERYKLEIGIGYYTSLNEKLRARNNKDLFNNIYNINTLITNVLLDFKRCKKINENKLIKTLDSKNV